MSDQILLCPHFDCPGCSLDQEEPKALPLLKSFFASWSCPVFYEAGSCTGWRSRSKLAVRAKNGSFVVGLFREGTHDVVDVSGCLMHTQAINRALSRCQDRLRKEEGLSFYHESTHQGALRYLLLSEETTTHRVSVTFVLNGTREREKFSAFGQRLLDEDPKLFHSVWLNIQSQTTNRIVGERSFHVAGDIWQWERLGSVDVPFHPFHFRQANLPLFSFLLADLEKHILPKTALLDLFCGMGVIGLSVCHKARQVTCIEVDREAEKSFLEAKKRLPEALQDRISFHALSCNDHAVDPFLEGAETVVVDPPRKGLSRRLMEQISQGSASRLIYISCCEKTLLENLEFLFQYSWKPTFVKAYQFFPKTDHIETLVVLVRYTPSNS